MSNNEFRMSKFAVATINHPLGGTMKYDLEKRLIDLAALAIDVAESLPPTRAGNYLAGQLVRSGTSPALNYGEAQGAESRNDFIHEMKVVLKELRETSICLAIIDRKDLSQKHAMVPKVAEECRQLVAILSEAFRRRNPR